MLIYTEREVGFMNEKLMEFFSTSEINVFFCDRTSHEIIWANKEEMRKMTGRNAEELFEGNAFPEKTGIVSGLSGGMPYRYNITETDDCIVIEILSSNILSDAMKIDSVRKKFHFEVINIKEYIHEINRNIENIEEYFDKEDMYDEMESLAKILNDCYNILRIQRQREEYDFYITGKNLEPMPFCVNDFLGCNDEILKGFAGRKASVLEFEYEGDDLFVNVSPERFSWVVFHTVYIILKNFSDHPSVKISLSLSGNEVAVRIGRNNIDSPESSGVRDCTRYIMGDPFEKTFDFAVMEEFCRKFGGRHLSEFVGQRLSAVTLFVPTVEKPANYRLESIKNIISDKRFSDMRVNIYETANLKFIYY